VQGRIESRSQRCREGARAQRAVYAAKEPAPICVCLSVMKKGNELSYYRSAYTRPFMPCHHAYNNDSSNLFAFLS
jgi:hypothetical protein